MIKRRKPQAPTPAGAPTEEKKTVRIVPMKRTNGKTGETQIVGYLPFVFGEDGFLEERALGWSYLGTFATPEAAQAAYDCAATTGRNLYRTYEIPETLETTIEIAEPNT